VLALLLLLPPLLLVLYRQLDNYKLIIIN